MYKYSCLGVYRTMVSDLFFCEISTSRAKGCYLSGVTGNNSSKGKMRISEHGSHDAVEQKYGQDQNAFWGVEDEQTGRDFGRKEGGEMLWWLVVGSSKCP